MKISTIGKRFELRQADNGCRGHAPPPECHGRTPIIYKVHLSIWKAHNPDFYLQGLEIALICAKNRAPDPL